MKDITKIVVGVVLVVGLVYGSWKLDRWFKYQQVKTSVQSQIEVQLNPLIERVKVLEMEVQILKTNK